jgi:hypothetical protein
MSLAGCVLAALLVPAYALAQGAEDGATSARIHLGPLGLSPRIAVRNMGVDTNVLRSSGTAKKDFTATFEPELDSWLRVGRAHFSGKSSVEWQYFGNSTTQRSMGRSQTGSVDLRLSHFTPYGSLGYLRTEKPTSLEIDTRVPQTTTSRRAGVRANLGAALSLDLEGLATTFELDRVSAGDAAMADSLNRHVTATTASLRYIATPLTTVVLKTNVERDRFDVTPLRNSDSVSVTPGFEFKPFALISGNAFVGYRHFNALDPAVPDYTGVTASGGLTYIAREMTRVAVGFRRDIEYSFEVTQPYYVATGTDLSLTQMLGSSWDVVGRIGRTRMDYRNVLNAVAAEARKDRMSSWGIGTGRHLASGVRIGFDVDYMHRLSVVDSRGFHGFRFGGSVTYGS